MPKDITDTGLMKHIWTARYKIHSYEVDINQRATLPVLCGYLQETARHHAHNLKNGYEHLLKENKMWVLSRLYIKMNTYPKWGDEITIRTWPIGVKRLFALRDFEIFNGNENLLGSVTTAWLIIDIGSRKLQRPDPFYTDIPLLPDRHALIDDLEKIPLPESGEVLHPDTVRYTVRYTVQYSDLDLHSHVNNAKYIEWVLNSYPPQRHREQWIRYFKIQYISETLYGDDVSLRFHTIDDTDRDFIISAVKSSDKSEVFRAKLQWEDDSIAVSGIHV